MRILIKKVHAYHVLSFLIFCSASIYITYPLIFNLGNYTTGYGDELVIAWIQNWVIHTLLEGSIFSLFDANIYYPFLHSFAYSDLLLTSSIFSLLPLAFVKEPITVVNITLITSLILLGFSTYLLSFYLTRNFILSLLSGLLIIFSPAVLDKVMHLQILAIYWVPLSILFFFKFISTNKTKFLILTLICFLLQTYNSFLPGYFIIFSLTVITLFHFFLDPKKIMQLLIRKNMILIFGSLLFLIPIVVPYYQVSKEFDYVRDIRETIHFAMQPEDFLYSSDHSRLRKYLNDLSFNRQSQNEEFKTGFIGLIFSLLCIVSLYFFIKNYRKKDIVLNSFVGISFLGFILSLGPFLHLGRQTIHIPFPIPLPYIFFYYLAPGFQGFRNSARWEMLFILTIAIVIALVLNQVLEKLSSKKKILLYIFLFVGVIAEYNFPMKFFNLPPKNNFPPVYQWIASTPKESNIVELPIYNWNMWPFTQNELFREYYGTTHFRKTINGYSGFSPPPWQDLVEDILLDFPSSQTIQRLKKLGINYIIVHTDEYTTMYRSSFLLEGKKIKSGEVILKEISRQKNLKLIKQFEDTYIYTIQ